jgi:hypothetical protein
MRSSGLKDRKRNPPKLGGKIDSGERQAVE